MNKFIKEEFTEPYKHSIKYNVKTVKIRKDNKKLLKINEVKAIGEKLLSNAKQHNKNAKILVRVSSSLGMNSTLKGYSETFSEMIENEQDYLNQRVENINKFLEYDKASFTIIY